MFHIVSNWQSLIQILLSQSTLMDNDPVYSNPYPAADHRWLNSFQILSSQLFILSFHFFVIATSIQDFDDCPVFSFSTNALTMSWIIKPPKSKCPSYLLPEKASSHLTPDQSDKHFDNNRRCPVYHCVRSWFFRSAHFSQTWLSWLASYPSGEFCRQEFCL